MIDILDTADDVIALRLSGRLSREELDRVTELLERALVECDKTHIYAEITDISGFDMAALPHYLPRAAKMLGRLDRFGRIAIVADTAWIRWATRVESAILPHIHYETYRLEERDRALAWVEGRSDLPHAPALRIIETDREDVFGFELDGRITAAEMSAITETVTELLDGRGGPLRVLGRFTRFAMPELSGLFTADYVRMKLAALERVERYAIVGGPLWLAGWVTLINPLLKMELRHFASEREPAAWEWLGAHPHGQRALAA